MDVSPEAGALEARVRRPMPFAYKLEVVVKIHSPRELSPRGLYYRPLLFYFPQEDAVAMK